MPDDIVQSWAIRSTMAVVSNLDRSIAFYSEIGPFEEIIRDDAVALLGYTSTASIVLILREARNPHVRHGQMSLGLRSTTFSVGPPSELDRIESVLRRHDLFTSRRVLVDGASEVLLGRDPDNLPLVLVSYGEEEILGLDHYRTVAEMAFAMDV